MAMLQRALGVPRWVTLLTPTRSDFDRLREEHALPDEIVEHALDPNERPRVRAAADTISLFLRVPIVEKGPTFETAPVVLVTTPGWNLLTCARDGALVRELARFAAVESDPNRVFLRAFELTAQAYLQALDALEREVEATEKRLGSSLENREVLVLLEHQKSLVHFCAALDGTILLLDRLPKAVAMADEAWLADIRIELRQAVDTANLQRSVLSEMMDAFASIISNNLNVVMKFLAAATVVLTVPMIVASFYGMNVALPGQASAYAFAGSLVVSLALCIAVAVAFRRHGWI